MMQVLFWLSIGLDRRTPSEHLLSAIVEALYRQGHTVHILQKDTGGDKAEIPPCMAALGVTATGIRSDPPKRSNLIARYAADIRYIASCRKWLKKNRGYDRVFLQSSNVAGMQVYILRKLLKDVPITFNVQDIFPENAVYSGTLSRGGLPCTVLSAIQKYAYRHADRIITISEDMQAQLIELGTPADKIEVIYNWSYQDAPYDLTQLEYTRVAPLFDKSKFNVVYAGNIGRMQNVEIVIQAAVQMRAQKDIAFHIIGDGVYKDRLVTLAQQLHADNVTFHPMLDSKDAPALYASADVNVIPLAKDIYRTALPSKTATCLACGKPIIFAIGTESVFGKKIKADFDCDVVSSTDEKQLMEAILAVKVKANAGCSPAEDGAYAAFSKTDNSRRYTQIILAD